MKIGQILSALTAASVLSAVIPTVSAVEYDATNYSYEVMPILEGMNEYYFVKTDNPNPKTFTFVDKDTKYYDGDYSLSRCTYEFADVKYENTETLRVDGGYLFAASRSDGGTLTLKVRNDLNSYYSSWAETDITCEVPETVDRYDYLINTYATKDDFFENMDAVEAGLQSICVYNRSYIRGELYQRPGEYWGLLTSPYMDQYLAKLSPYSRRGDEELFASNIFPYRCDSLGFPGVLWTVAERLEPTAIIENDDAHYLINITYNGTTKKYGGCGNVQGKKISKDKIIKYFHFGTDEDTLNLADSRQLLVDYSRVVMDNDIPTEGSLTWEQVTDTVGDGCWAKLRGSTAYLYKADDKYKFSTSSYGEGSSMYWGGSLGFASNS